jgi:hypothetical protein
VNHSIDTIVSQNSRYTVVIADVAPLKMIVGCSGYILHIGQISGIGQFIEIDNAVIGVTLHKAPHHVTSNEAGSSGD